MARYAGLAALLLVWASATAEPGTTVVRTIRLVLAGFPEPPGRENPGAAEPQATDTERAGHLAVSAGRILRLHGWGLAPGDTLAPDWAWRWQPGAVARTLLVTLAAPADAALQVTAGTASGSVSLAALDAGAPLPVPNVAATADLLPTPQRVSGAGDADFPALVAGPGGDLWCAWVSFDGRGDTIHLAQYTAGRWESRGTIPSARGRVSRVALAAPDTDRLVAVWGQEDHGTWDLYSAVFTEGRWRKRVRVTRTPGSDLNHQVIADANGRVWLAWQAFEGSFAHIRLAWWEQGKWAPSILVSEARANQWAPALTAGPDGQLYIAWDSCEAGNYDIYLRSMRDGRLSDIRRITDGPEYEANVSLACEPGGRLWIAYDRGEADWGALEHAAALHRERQVAIRCLEGEALTAPPLPELEAGAAAPFAENGRLFADARGQVWLLLRRTLRNSTWDLVAHRFDGHRWSRPLLLPDSAGRSDMAATLAATADGSSWVAWASDAAEGGSIHHAVFAAPLPAGTPAPERLSFAAVPAPTAVGTTWQARERPVGRFGREGFTLYQGDLHRHTELAACHPFTHGSVQDAYRYALDAAQLDFIALMAPLHGGDAYRWHLQQKLASLFSVDGTLVALSGAECLTPSGAPGAVFLERPERAVTPAAAATAWSELVVGRGTDGDLAVLYARDATALPAEPGQGPHLVAPLEGPADCAGAPSSAAPDARASTAAPTPDTWWLTRTARAAVVAGTGHRAVSTRTHLWAGYLTRESILTALHRRRAYIGPPTLTLHFSAQDRPLGSVVYPAGKPLNLRVQVSGAAGMRLELLRDGQPVERVDVADSGEAELTYTHTGPTPDGCAYAVRLVTEAGEQCWTTPIWVASERSPRR